MIKPSTIEAAHREGLILQQRGSDYWGLCPFPGHTEKTASFKIGNQGFYCFGCNTGGGDSIDLVQKIHGLTFSDALAYLGIQRQTPINRQAAAEARRERERKADLLRRFRSWEQGQVDYLASMLRTFRSMQARARTESELQAVAEMCRAMDEVEHVYENILCRKDDAPKFELYQEAGHAGN